MNPVIKDRMKEPVSARHGFIVSEAQSAGLRVIGEQAFSLISEAMTMGW